MFVEIIKTWPELSALRSAWNELSAGSPFRSWDWLAMWWRHYGTSGVSPGKHVGAAERQLYVVAVFSESQVDGRRGLIGIAPWYLDRAIVKGNVLRWLGSGEVCTDHLSFICRTHLEGQVASAVADALSTRCDEWDLLELSAVDADDVSVGALIHALEDRDCLVSREPADSCWVLNLPASWDEYLAMLSKSHRKQLRQLERRVLQTDRVRWHRVANRQEVETAWSVLVDLHQRRRQSLGERGCFASRAFHDFHHDVIGLLLERGQLRMSWLELDGTAAAAEYHLTDGAATYAYQGGVDPTRMDEEPGRLSTILCLQRAIAEGCRFFDFLRGEEPYKAHWRAAPRKTYEYRVVPNRRLPRLRGRVLSFTDTVSDWLRPATTPLPQ